jgi:D-alanyl-D-alanine dipeptidase
MYENPDYVADPRKGSMHNRGAAVDLTLVDKSGKELDMGTEFDFFGEKAHHAYTQFPKQVLANRELLKTGMRLAGFSEIKTEWWHYSYTSEPFNLSDMPFDCK